MMDDELGRVRKKQRPFASLHEALGVLMEEFDEFKDEVYKRAENRDMANLLQELVQVAAGCQRAAEDLVLKVPDQVLSPQV